MGDYLNRSADSGSGSSWFVGTPKTWRPEASRDREAVLGPFRSAIKLSI